MAIDPAYIFNPNNTQESYIEHIVLLQRYLENYDCLNSIDVIHVVFQVLNKGLPQIDVIPSFVRRLVLRVGYPNLDIEPAI